MASPRIAAKPRSAKTIGFAFGTFDLFHDGHRYLLYQARRRCDELIVAIHSDRFARKLKGPGHPVDDETVRSHNIAATELARYVIAVDSWLQLQQAFLYYDPDLLFSGDKPHNRAALEDAPGPSIVLIPLLEGYTMANAIKGRLQ